MTQDKTFLGTEPIGKLLVKLAVPTVVAQLVNMLYNIVDRIYIGHMPGDGSLALTGVGVCLPLIMIISAFAALATVISQGLSCVWVICFLRGKKTLLRLKRENLLVSPKLILPCVALGLAAFIMQSSESMISVCFNSSLLRYGGDVAVGAMTILSSVMQFAMLPLQGIAQGAQPISSYNYGARNADRVRQTFRLLLRVCLVYSMVLWAGIMLFPRGFAGIFTPDAEPGWPPPSRRTGRNSPRRG